MKAAIPLEPSWPLSRGLVTCGWSMCGLWVWMSECLMKLIWKHERNSFGNSWGHLSLLHLAATIMQHCDYTFRIFLQWYRSRKEAIMKYQMHASTRFSRSLDNAVSDATTLGNWRFVWLPCHHWADSLCPHLLMILQSERLPCTWVLERNRIWDSRHQLRMRGKYHSCANTRENHEELTQNQTTQHWHSVEECLQSLHLCMRIIVIYCVYWYILYWICLKMHSIAQHSVVRVTACQCLSTHVNQTARALWCFAFVMLLWQYVTPLLV